MNFKLEKNLAIQILILTGVFVALYSHAIATLIYDWSNNANFSHGFLIPFVAAYMVWHKKETLKTIEIKSSPAGIGVIVFGMLCYLAGTIGSELFVMRSSMIITISGMVIYLFGFQIFKAVLIPILYLILMIPIPAIIWNKIAFPLQLFAANLSSGMVHLLGIPVLRDGNILHLANTSLEVVDACSGIRSLTSLLALSGAFAFIAPLGNFKKWVLFFSALPIAVVVNIVRLTITAVMATYIGPEAAQGFLHEMSGILVFAVALALVYLVFIIELKFEK
ncbi:conserved hypothetical protein [Desulforapulum autotrophicum HRM2]|uniref:Eight transmembrane protein EpsH n=1 Tax=Desulforapulum autotrophicum (strain ATCC 43914 / DSM 3382 / VKM B-1955 / HRM2) TaxID=177437 RepID=C0QCK2_DESAH|nr:exosortase/archaeosortase family protein [Desulforapulum autotrophicum]ACN15079.1 conserved hypothetical protein [Desulforapulum autotrophicum HRM2]